MKKNLLKNIAVLTLIGSLCLGLAACGKKADAANSESQIDKIKKAGKLVVGTSADYPPYEFHATRNGEDKIVGFEMSIANEVAKDLGVKLEINDMDFDGVLNAIPAGKVDMGIASINPTDERRKNMDFSDIYFKAPQTVIIREADKDKYTTVESLYGKEIGAQKGTIQYQIAESQITGAKLKGLGKVTDLVLALQSGKVEGIVVESVVAEAYVKNNEGLAVVPFELQDLSDGGCAVAIKKGNSDLTEQVNKTIKRLVDDGSINKFIDEAKKIMNK